MRYQMNIPTPPDRAPGAFLLAAALAGRGAGAELERADAISAHR